MVYKTLFLLFGWLAAIFVYPIFAAGIVIFVFFPWTLIAIRKKKKQIGETGEGWYRRSKGLVLVEDKQLKCPHCTNTTFRKREGILHTTWVSLFLFFAALNQSAVCYECSQCGYLSWFSRPKEKFLKDRETVSREKASNTEENSADLTHIA